MRYIHRLLLIFAVGLLIVTPASAQDDALQPGDSIDGMLTNSNLSARFPLEGVAGEVVSITLRSDDFDSYLILEDPNGFEIATNDDGAGNLNSLIGPFIFPVDGIYTIVATSLSRSDTGAFTLSVATTDIRPIEYTQTLNSRLTDDRLLALYRFRGQSGDVISIRLESNDFDAYLELASGNDPSVVLMSNDDSGGTRNAFIGPFTLPQTGDYIITARALNRVDTGDFTLTLDRVVLTPINYGATVMSEFTRSNQTLYFTFAGRAGDVVNIFVESPDEVDTVLTLNHPDGYQIISDDDSGRGFNPELNRVLLDSDGNYTILLSTFGAGATGAATLSLERAVLASLDDGPQQIQLNDKIFQDIVTFSGTSGERVTLSIVELNGHEAAPNITVLQDGLSIASLNASEVTATSFSFEIPDSGDIIVRVEDFGFETVNYEITLKRESE